MTAQYFKFSWYSVHIVEQMYDPHYFSLYAESN